MLALRTTLRRSAAAVTRAVRQPQKPQQMKVQRGTFVTLAYEDLMADKDLGAEIEEAYGPNGIGLLTVSGVPTLAECRSNLLPLAREFAMLPEEVKAKYVHADSYYSFGWSHGKEKLQGAPDWSKGSYYANPIYDQPETDEEIIRKYPPFVHPNIWPEEEMPQLSVAFKDMGRLIVQIGLLVARQCDRYVHAQVQTYPPTMLHDIINTSMCAKGRLLHYFSRSAEELAEREQNKNVEFEYSDWCGAHNDHGSLTGLCSEMYLDEDGNEVEIDDPQAGLYAYSRSGELVKVNIPRDHMGFQIGETAQIHSGGVLEATPHAVRGAAQPGISREQFAVFMEPMYDHHMRVPAGIEPNQAQRQQSAASLPKGVPPIATRWNNDMDFNDFSEATLSSYY